MTARVTFSKGRALLKAAAPSVWDSATPATKLASDKARVQKRLAELSSTGNVDAKARAARLQGIEAREAGIALQTAIATPQELQKFVESGQLSQLSKEEQSKILIAQRADKSLAQLRREVAASRAAGTRERSAAARQAVDAAQRAENDSAEVQRLLGEVRDAAPGPARAAAQADLVAAQDRLAAALAALQASSEATGTQTADALRDLRLGAATSANLAQEASARVQTLLSEVRNAVAGPERAAAQAELVAAQGRLADALGALQTSTDALREQSSEATAAGAQTVEELRRLIQISDLDNVAASEPETAAPETAREDTGELVRTLVEQLRTAHDVAVAGAQRGVLKHFASPSVPAYEPATAEDRQRSLVGLKQLENLPTGRGSGGARLKALQTEAKKSPRLAAAMAQMNPQDIYNLVRGATPQQSLHAQHVIETMSGLTPEDIQAPGVRNMLFGPQRVYVQPAPAGFDAEQGLRGEGVGAWKTVARRAMDAAERGDAAGAARMLVALHEDPRYSDAPAHKLEEVSQYVLNLGK